MAATKALLVILIAVVVVGLGLIYAGAFDVGADTPHWALTRTLLETARERSIAVQARGIQVVPLDDPALLAEGAEHYAEMCTQCHLAPGMPETETRAGLNPRPPNLTQSGADHSPAETFWIIKHGIRMTGMPAWGPTHSDSKIWAMTAFVRRLPTLSAAQYHELVPADHAEQHSHDRMDMHQN